MKKEPKKNINYKITQLKNGFRYNDRLPSDMEAYCGKIICKVLNLPKSSIIFNERITINPFEIDIFIPSKQLAIEIQDKKSYYGENRVVSDNDYNFKKDWCAKLSVKIIRIPYNYPNEKDIRDILNGQENKAYKRKDHHFEKVRKYYYND